MSDERPPVTISGGIQVSAEDADLIERDTLLYGNAYVEVFETGLGRRIDPATVTHEPQLGMIHVRDE